MRKNKRLFQRLLEAYDHITAGNREQERELTALLAPIDPRLNVLIFNKGDFAFTVAVGYNGAVNYQPGTRFSFGIDRRSLRPFAGDEELCVDFEENPGWAMEWMRQEVARALWNYFRHRPDRVLSAVDPLKAQSMASRAA
jgi:hypothetical protein